MRLPLDKRHYLITEKKTGITCTKIAIILQKLNENPLQVLGFC
jgi:hypothetical protein